SRSGASLAGPVVRGTARRAARPCRSPRSGGGAPASHIAPATGRLDPDRPEPPDPSDPRGPRGPGPPGPPGETRTASCSVESPGRGAPRARGDLRGGRRGAGGAAGFLVRGPLGLLRF